MALILADRVRETSTTTGTGALSLAGAVVGYQTFSSAIGNTNTCYYAISNPGVAEWEVGIGTYATSGNTLTRTTILKSSNANAAVNFSAGTKDVFVTYPATKSVYLDASGNVTLAGGLGVGGSAAPGSTGLAVTGTLSATGALTAGTGSAFSTNQNADTTLRLTNTTSGTAAGTTLFIGDGSIVFGLLRYNTSHTAYGNLAAGDNALYSSSQTVRFANDIPNPIWKWTGASGLTTDYMALSSTGLAVTGTLSATGVISNGSGTTTTAGLQLAVGVVSAYGTIHAQNLSPSASNYAIAVKTDNQLNAINAGVEVAIQVATNAIGQFSSTGLAVTGTLSSTLDATIYGVTVGRGGGAVSTNTAVGASALAATNTNTYQVAVGYQALQINTSGGQNTAVGGQTLTLNTTSASNVAVGFQALQLNTAADNTAVGTYALNINTSGASNVAVGKQALGANTTASNNTAVGYQAGYSNTTGIFTAIGYKAGYSNTTGNYNTFVGNLAGNANTTSSENTAVGYQAGSASTGADNTYLGVYAGYNATTGTYNCYVGTGAGFSMTTGAKNTILGSYNGNQGGLDIRTASNYVVLSDGDGNPRGFFDGSGNFTAATSNATGGHKLSKGSANGRFQLQVGESYPVIFYEGNGYGFNVAASLIEVSVNTVTSRSINAGGTINSLGTDYAEYMTKASDFTIAKGDVVGIDAQGKLTNVFANAVSFMVKSTNPSFVGGDSWGSVDVLGQRPNEDATQEVKDAFNAALETARQTVDRIAFAGQVPVNVTGATAGQYIIPVNDNGAIKGQAVSNPTFEQYQIAVGKVIAIESDGRAKIIVKVA